MFYLRYQDDRVKRDWSEPTYDQVVHVHRGVCKVDTRASADALRTHAGFHFIEEEEYNAVLSGKQVESACGPVAAIDAGKDGTDEFSWGTDNVAPTKRGRPKGSRNRAPRVGKA